jgi:hypothetical protein
LLKLFVERFFAIIDFLFISLLLGAALSCLVLHAPLAGRTLPAGWGGRLRCWLATPLPLPQQWTCSAVQIVTRVPLSLYLGPRLVNVVSGAASEQRARAAL